MNRQLAVQFEYRGGFDFASFVAGPNLEIVSTLKQAAHGLGNRHIHIHGEIGSGKTHLLQAMAQEARSHGRESFYLPLTQPGLSHELLSGLEQFDLVVLDDLDRIADHPDWELSLFNLYNNLQIEKKQLVVSSRFSPKMLSLDLVDLKTRLNWGLTLKIKALSEAELMTVVQEKTKHFGCPLKPEAAQYLLTHFGKEPSKLWSLLERLDREALSAKRRLTIPFIKEVLKQPAR